MKLSDAMLVGSLKFPKQCFNAFFTYRNHNAVAACAIGCAESAGYCVSSFQSEEYDMAYHRVLHMNDEMRLSVAEIQRRVRALGY